MDKKEYWYGQRGTFVWESRYICMGSGNARSMVD